MSHFKNQRDIIVEWLRKRPLTSMAAFDSLKIINLSGRIAELRQMGYQIENVWAEVNGIRFVRYTLVSEPK